MRNWSPEQWVFVIGGSLSALGSLITVVIHAFASRQGREENRAQNRAILQQVSEVKGQLEGQTEVPVTERARVPKREK